MLGQRFDGDGFRVWDAGTKPGLMTMDDKSLILTKSRGKILVDFVRYDGRAVAFVELNKGGARDLRDHLNILLGDSQ